MFRQFPCRRKNIKLQVVSTVGIQLLGKLLIAILGVLFARLLGPEDYGTYSYILSVITIATLPVVAGVPNLVIRELSIYQKKGLWSLVLGLISWCRCYIFLMSVISSLLVFLFYQLGVIKGVNAQLVIIATLLVPVRALLAQQCAFLNAFQKPALAKVPEQIILPFISALFLFFIYYYFPNLTLEVVLMSVVLASILSQIISLVISRKTVDIKHENVKSKWKTKVWSRSLVPFAIIAFIYTLNSEVATIFLGNLGSHEEVAYFKVAIQAVAIISIGLSSVNSVIMPKVAMTYESGDVILTQHIIRKGVRYSFALSIFIALAYVLFGKELIELLFGSGYEKVYDILVVLTIYQMIDVILGPVGLILNMTGNEGKTVYRLVFVLFVNVVLLYFLTPLYGAIGAAYAMLISLVILKILMCFAVYKTTGLRSYIH